MSDTKLETMKLEDICCACLSFERKLSPLNYTVDGVNNLFSLLSHNSEPQQATLDAQLTQLSICWECGAVLRRLCGFRRQVCYARRQLMLLLDNEHDIDKNRECLSKLSYNYKRSFDKELVYSDVHNKNDASDDEPGVYIRGDWEPKVNDVKTETENKELNQDENTLSDFNYNDNTVKEENTTKESFAVKQNNTIKKQLKSCVTKQEVEIQDGGGDDDYITVEIESEPKRSVAKRKIKDTAKRKTGAKVKRNNLKTVKNELEEENKKVTEQNVPIAPKTRRPRKVQNRSQDPEYPCADCDQVFTTYTRRYEHIMKYHKEGYQCSACGKRFHIKKSFLRHEQVHIAKTLPREKCPTCDAMVRCDLVAEHARRHASTDAAEYACAPCNKRFANRNSYKKHMTEAKAHLADLEKKYECETCHKWFPTLLLYNCHMRYTKRHAVRAAVYKCAMCDKSVRSPAALRDHVHYVHMGKTSHKCAVCDKALASPQCVARHMKLFHGGYKYPKNKLCDTCGKAFSSKKDLREHESVHTGDRPLKCDVCGDTFRQSGALYTHKRRVHKVPLKPSVELVTEPDETVERLIQDCELTETDLVINRVINLKRD